MAAILVMASSACRSGGFDFYVRNGTSQAWLLRTTSSDTESDSYRVVRVQPDASGLAFQDVDTGFVIELLSDLCAPAGVFEAEGGRYIVADVAGVDGELRPARSAEPGSGVSATAECGGSLVF